MPNLFGVSKINVIFATCKKFYTPQRYEYLLIYKAKKMKKSVLTEWEIINWMINSGVSDCVEVRKKSISFHLNGYPANGCAMVQLIEHLGEEFEVICRKMSECWIELKREDAKRIKE